MLARLRLRRGRNRLPCRTLRNEDVRSRSVHFIALATDYDGTIAEHGVVAAATVEALKKLKETGRRLVLITGRQLDDVLAAFPEAPLFDRIVAENGAVVFDPAGRKEQVIGARPPDAFVEALKTLKIEPLSMGRSIVATWEPNEHAVFETIHRLGLELQVIFNKGAVMVLPPGINKAAGLEAVLAGLSISPFNTAGIGDAENDHAFLKLCGCSAAVD